MKRVFQDITNVSRKNIKVKVYKSSHRKKLFKWLYEVTRDFGYSQVTFGTAVVISDRYTSRCGLDLSDYQLIGITSLFITAKIEETQCKPLSDYAQVTDNAFSVGNLLDKEIDILKALDFDLFVKLPHRFLSVEYLSLRGDRYTLEERQEIFFAVFSYIMERDTCVSNMYWVYLEGVREAEKILDGHEIDKELYFYLVQNPLMKKHFAIK